jgi:alanine racemase
MADFGELRVADALKDARPPAAGVIRVDLEALVANYRELCRTLEPTPVAAVVKADAYGLGVDAVSEALTAAGCEHFFVAHLEEGLAVRRRVPAAAVYVLNGLWDGTEPLAAEAQLTPVLNSLGQIERWRALASTRAERLPAAIQIDSGMSRLGLCPEHVSWLADRPDIFAQLDVRYLMSHFACADAPDAEANAHQQAAFETAIAKLPSTPVSMANSAAALARASARGALVRCGIALYGGAALIDAGRLRPVLQLSARVVQLRTVPAGAGVGYGHDFIAPDARRLATVALGYADGLPRHLGGKGAVFFQGTRLPILGRISMDSFMVDASALPPGELKCGDLVELIGPHQSLDAFAASAGTISYEVLTNLSRRLPRTYAGGALS